MNHKTLSSWSGLRLGPFAQNVQEVSRSVEASHLVMNGTFGE